MFGTTCTNKRNVKFTAKDLKVKLHLCRVCLEDNVYNELKEKREADGQPAWYPVVRSMIRTVAFAGDTSKSEKDDVFVGRVPDRMIVGLVDSRAFNGTLEYYPFAFQKFGLTEIRQIIDDEAYPYKSLKMVGNDGNADWRGTTGSWKPMEPGTGTVRVC